MLASILLSACVVPYRLHLTSIVTAPDKAAPIAARLRGESFAAVAKSLPKDDYSVGFSDIGWVTRSEIADTAFAPAAKLPVGGTTKVGDEITTSFVHVEEIRAEMPCDEAVARYPDDQTAFLVRAATRWQAGNHTGAIDDYTAVIRLDPKSYSGHYGRAGAYYYERKYPEALADADAVLAPAPLGGADVYTLKGLIEEALGDDDLATADEAFAIAQYHGYMRDETGAHAALGVAYSNLGYFAAAVEEFDLRLKRHPDDSATYLARGFARFSAGDRAGAKSDFVTADRAMATSATPPLALAILSFSAGDTTAGLRYARLAAARSPRDPYAVLWDLILSRASHRAPQVASAQALADSPAWPSAVIRVFLGRAPVGSLRSAVSTGETLHARTQSCEAQFYAGVYELTGGDRARALPALRLAAGDCPFREYERAAARQLLTSRVAEHFGPVRASL